MKNSLIKFLPIIAAVLLATSCSKDDNDNAPASESGRDGVHTVSTTGIPFTIRVNTGRSLKKMAYENGTEVGSYQPKFEQNDEDILTMIIKDGNDVIGNLTLDDAKTASFSGNLTQQPSSNADLTAEITVTPAEAKTFSNESLAALLATCAHTFLGTFNYGDENVDLTDQNAYLAISMSPCCDHEIKINTTDYTVKDGRIWIAIPADADVTSTGLGSEISKKAEEVSPGTIYTVARQYFTVADGKKVYFSKGNLQYNPLATNPWRFAEHQYDLCETSNCDVSSKYKATGTDWIDLFGWGTWLDGENVLKPYEIQTDDPSYIWSGNSAIGENWTTLSKDEWIYLLGIDKANETPCRKDAKTLRATKEVNGVFGLVILPDGSTANIANDSWETLESAGAVFLPAAGRRHGTGVSDVGYYGYYWSSSDSYENNAYFLIFKSGNVRPDFAFGRDYGLSVRLVRAAL